MKAFWGIFLAWVVTGLLTAAEVSTWCPGQDHGHTSGFRVGQWIKKNGMYQRSRICKKNDCKFYLAKQIQHKK